MLTFPAPSSSYSLTSYLDELFFLPDPQHQILPIPVLHIPCPERSGAAPPPSGYVLVHAHSNGCDAGDMMSAMKSLAHHLAVDIFLLEYPGYGLFEVGVVLVFG